MNAHTELEVVPPGTKPKWSKWKKILLGGFLLAFGIGVALVAAIVVPGMADRSANGIEADKTIADLQAIKAKIANQPITNLQIQAANRLQGQSQAHLQVIRLSDAPCQEECLAVSGQVPLGACWHVAYALFFSEKDSFFVNGHYFDVSHGSRTGKEAADVLDACSNLPNHPDGQPASFLIPLAPHS